MINPKTTQRKKTQHPIPTKDHHKEVQHQIKRKKSVSNLAHSTKSKKQTIHDIQQKQTKKPKQQKQRKLTHSLSKGKINKKHHKSERNDENYNSMNHKKSIEKFNTVSKNSKEIIKPKKSIDETTNQMKHQKIKSSQIDCHLSKIPLEAKIIGLKKVQKKKNQTKQINDERHPYRYDQRQKNQEEKPKNVSNQATKTLTRNPTSKKLITGQKTKLKKSSSQIQSQPRKSTRQKIKPNSKIAEIIQRSILYSDVNYDFKDQMSLLGSGIKKQEDFFVPYPFQFQKTKSVVYSKQENQRFNIEHKAAITIQRHFRGYIQRKYIQQARYIIDCVKKIQRFWRVCLLKKNLKRNQNKKKKNLNQKQGTFTKNSVENSLITVKDLNEDTYRQKDLDFLKKNGPNEDVDKDMLKEIIKNLLSQDTVNQSIKQKIRNVMADESKKQSQQQKRQKPKQSTTQLKSTKTPLQTLEIQIQHNQQEHPKQDYVKRKINMEINSERNFNSPMSSLSKDFLTSPNLKRLTSPKCLSSSFSKDVKSSYNNYFKSNKNGGGFMSPKSSKQEAQRLLKSHSGSKRSKQKQTLNECLNFQQANHKLSRNFQFQQPISQIPHQDFRPHQVINSQKQQSLELTKNDYLLKQDINVGSPIIQCKQGSQSFNQQVNLLETQKIQFSEQQTQRFVPNKNYKEQTQLVDYKSLKPFPTEFCFIEEFCLLITDYLREDEETSEVFLEKVKGLKYCKIQKVFQQWQGIEFQQYWCENEPLRMMILQEHTKRPAIFSRTEKNLLLQYPSLRLFLSENDYSAEQIFRESHPKAGYIRFMFDVFEECIFQNYRHVGLRELAAVENKESKKGGDYMSVILSQAMGNMLRSAQMLCGSFESEDMTEYEKEERQLMNQMRLGEMIKDYREEKLDESSCVMWIQLLLGKVVFEEIIQQSLDQMSKLIHSKY